MGMTDRTRKFIMEVTTNGKSPEEAVRAAGLKSEHLPALMNSPEVRREIDTRLAELGITDHYFATKLMSLCEATNAKGHPDYATQLKALTIIMAIKGYEAPKKVEQTTTVVTYEERLLMIADDESRPKLTEVICLDA